MSEQAHIPIVSELRALIASGKPIPGAAEIVGIYRHMAAECRAEDMKQTRDLLLQAASELEAHARATTPEPAKVIAGTESVEQLQSVPVSRAERAKLLDAAVAAKAKA